MLQCAPEEASSSTGMPFLDDIVPAEERAADMIRLTTGSTPTKMTRGEMDSLEKEGEIHGTILQVSPSEEEKVEESPLIILYKRYQRDLFQESCVLWPSISLSASMSFRKESCRIDKQNALSLHVKQSIHGHMHDTLSCAAQ